MSRDFYRAMFDAVFSVVKNPLVVPNLGTNTALLMEVGPRDADLYMWGGMGLTHSIALGVALAQPQRVVVALDGDGSLLMGMSGLATIGAERPSNLLHVVFDNHAWGNTGGQPTHTAARTSLAQVAAGCGYPRVVDEAEASDLRDAATSFIADPELTMVVVPTPIVDVGRGLELPDPPGIKTRFMRSLQRVGETSNERNTA